MEGGNRLVLVMLGLILPVVNFILVRPMFYSMTNVMPVWACNLLSSVVGLLIFAIFFSFAVETPIEAVVISSIILIFILVIRPVFLQAQQNAHSRTLKTRRQPAHSPSPQKMRPSHQGKTPP